MSEKCEKYTTVTTDGTRQLCQKLQQHEPMLEHSLENVGIHPWSNWEALHEWQLEVELEWGLLQETLE